MSAISIAKLETNTIDTVALISWVIITFSFEDVTEMTATCRASYFCSYHTHRAILVPCHSSRNSIKLIQESALIPLTRHVYRLGTYIGRPTASRVKFVLTRIQRCTAPCTFVHSFRFVMIVFPCTWHFSPLLPQYVELLPR